MVPPNASTGGYVGVAASVDPIAAEFTGLLDSNDWTTRGAGGAGQIWGAGTIEEIMDIGGVLAIGNNQASSVGMYVTVWPVRDAWRFGVQVSAGAVWAGVALPTFAPVVPERLWFYVVPTASLSATPLMGEAGLAIQPGSSPKTLQIGGRVATNIANALELGAAGVVVSYIAPLGAMKK